MVYVLPLFEETQLKILWEKQTFSWRLFFVLCLVTVVISRSGLWEPNELLGAFLAPENMQPAVLGFG